MQYYCKYQQRRERVRGHETLNGIDYLEVLDSQAPNDELRQRTLLVYCLKPITTSFDKDNARIQGGIRLRNIKVVWACVLVDSPEEWIKAEVADAIKEFVLVVRTDSAGDFSAYELALVASPTASTPPANFDPQLSRVTFSFKAECPSEFDCRAELECPPDQERPAPPIDYLSKDFASFRRLMLDRLSVVMPEWQERNVADVGIAVVEVLAHAADHLSYYQDAVSTEAYLGTARKRVSVRRHARLLDYHVHEGCNARTWVCFEVKKNSEADGFVLPQSTRLLAGAGLSSVVARANDLHAEIQGGAQVFETMHEITLYASQNERRFYTWGDEECCLPRGATRATIKNSGGELDDGNLKPGDVLVFEEVKGPGTGKAEDANPANRHAVRLILVDFSEDPLFHENQDGAQAQRVVNIEWHGQDALPFPLCLSMIVNGESVCDVSVARGNMVLVDHGYKADEEEITLPLIGVSRPRLKETEITYCSSFDKDTALRRPALEAIKQNPRAAEPYIQLKEQQGGASEWWEPKRDLLASDRFAREFVVEMEEDRLATLRFGDGVHGKRPPVGTRFNATYRIGNGSAGNVGAESIAHIVADISGIAGVRNPLAAQGGTDPEPLERVRFHAPQAIRTQERAVTDADYAEVAQRHPEVQQAAATRRWTGSWYTVFVAVDRKGGRPVDLEFERELRGFLERFRLAGHDLEVEPPLFVPLDILMRICVAPGYYPSDVKQALLEVFSNQELANGSQGFFHPDRFTFGQAVYLSHLVAAAMEVPGVQWVDVMTFKRWGKAPLQELEKGLVPMTRLEIARLDNDPSLPENGRIELVMEGGL